MLAERSKYANKTKRAWYFPETQEKICAKCGNKSSITNFFKHKSTQDGWHSWCKQCCKEGNDRSRAKKYATFEGRITTFLRTCQLSSKKRKQEFSLTEEILKDLWKQQGGICAYTGKLMTTEPNSPYSVSIERIDSSIGYVEDNVVLVCNAVNRMKSNLSPKLFFEMCSAVTLFLGDENGNLDVEFKK